VTDPVNTAYLYFLDVDTVLVISYNILKENIIRKNDKMNILLVYPVFADTFWGLKHALKFVHKKTGTPPLGLITVAAMLPSEWNLRLLDLNVTTLSDDDIAWADYAFVSAMVIQRDDAHRVIDRCKASGLTVVAGGPLFSGEYGDFPGVDHFVLNEAEVTLPLFLCDLARGTPRPMYTTTVFPDIRKTPVPRWDLVDMKHYATMNIQYSRGCPFNCEFCSITSMFGRVPRTKTSDQLIAELDVLYGLGWRGSVFVVDDNFIGNARQLKEDVLPALISWRRDKKGIPFNTEVSINLSDDDLLMKLMVEAGFNTVFVGIETPSEDGLAECSKSQNRGRDLLASVKRLQRAGLEVQGGFILGFDTDTPSIFQQQMDFIAHSGVVTAMVGLLQAPYGTRLYRRMEKEGRLNTEMSGDNSDGSTNIVTLMDPDVLHEGYRNVLTHIYSPRVYYDRVISFLRELRPPRVGVRRDRSNLMAFFRSILRLGILGPERYQYWRLWFWTLTHMPRLFPQAISLAIYGHHFRRVSAST